MISRLRRLWRRKRKPLRRKESVRCLLDADVETQRRVCEARNAISSYYEDLEDRLEKLNRSKKEAIY